MGPAPITFASAKYRGVRGETRPPFDPRDPIECSGPHLTAEFAADLVALYSRVCEVERWQPRCQDCLDEGPPVGLFHCDDCKHEHEAGGQPNADLILQGQRLCVACATRITLADPRFWIARASQLTDARCQVPAYVDGVEVRRMRIEILESWWLDLSIDRVVLPSTTHYVQPDLSGATLSFGALCELVHRRAASALATWPWVGWAVTAVFDRWFVWSLLATEVEPAPSAVKSTTITSLCRIAA